MLKFPVFPIFCYLPDFAIYIYHALPRIFGVCAVDLSVAYYSLGV